MGKEFVKTAAEQSSDVKVLIIIVLMVLFISVLAALIWFVVKRMGQTDSWLEELDKRDNCINKGMANLEKSIALIEQQVEQNTRLNNKIEDRLTVGQKSFSDQGVINEKTKLALEQMQALIVGLTARFVESNACELVRKEHMAEHKRIDDKFVGLDKTLHKFDKSLGELDKKMSAKIDTLTKLVQRASIYNGVDNPKS